MGHKIQNPSGVQPWYGQAFGKWYSIEPGGSIDVEDAEVASCLAAMGGIYGGTQAPAAPVVESPADAEARARAQAANAKTASVPASVAEEVARKQLTAGPEVSPEIAQATAAELKGGSLDDALDAAGLSKSGTADEKRARYAQWLTEQTGPAAPAEPTGEPEGAPQS